MTYLFALADLLSDPYVLIGWIAIMCAFAWTCFPYDERPRVKVRWYPWTIRVYRLWRIRRRQDRILWSGGQYVISQQMKDRWRVP